MIIPGVLTLSAGCGDMRLPAIVMAGDGDLIVHLGIHSASLAEVIAGADLRMVRRQTHFSNMPSLSRWWWPLTISLTASQVYPVFRGMDRDLASWTMAS